MKSIIKRIVAVLVVMTICIGIAGMFADVVKGSTTKKKDDTIYTVLMLDLGGSTLINSQPETSTLELFDCKYMVNEVKSAAKKYVEQSISERKNEKIAVVAYGKSATLICDFSKDLDSVIVNIDNAQVTGTGSNINNALNVADTTFKNINITTGKRNIINFTKGFCSAGNYTSVGRYSNEDCYWYNYINSIRFYSCANATYNTFEKIKDKYNIYTVYFLQDYDESYQKEVDLIDFSKRFAKDIQNAGYIEVDDVENLIFDFGGWDAPIITATFNFASNYAHKDVDAVCYYSDNYFESPSTEYNEHLSTMSFCLEMTTWSSMEDYAIWTDLEYSPIAKYMNARNLLQKIGFKDFAVNEFWKEAPTMDSIGAVAANKELPDGSTLIALAVRGGEYGKEWASNFTVGFAGEHAGFSEARDNVINFLYEYIDEKNIEGKVKLWIVGYSRGGAVANLTAAELSYPKDIPESVAEKVSWNREDVYGYTFEAPQGTQNIYKILGNYNNIHNIRNINDLVTYVAPTKWGFSRYGKVRLLPSWKYTGDEFPKLLAEMQKYLNQFEKSDEEVVFNVQEKVWMSDIKVNFTTISKWGQPIITGDIKDVYKYKLIKDVIDCLAEDIIGSRTNYYYFYQNFVREFMCFINEDEEERFEWKKFSTALSEKLTLERIIEIASPLIEVSLDPPDVREAKVKENIKELINEILKESDCTFSVESMNKLVSVLPELLYNLFSEAFCDYLFNDLDKIETICAFIGLIKQGILTQPHYPEYTFAWLMQDDSYYGENDNIEVGRTYRMIHINCPVDINVYSEDSGKLVASIIENVPQEIEDSYIGAWINDEEEKIVILPADTNYCVEILATGNGTFNFTIDEYSYDEQGNTRIINYYDIPIIAGETYTAKIPSMVEEELYSENSTGSSIVYSLTNENGVQIIPNNEIRGTEALETEYKVDVTNGNEYGYAYGGGRYSVGSFAKVVAYPMLGGTFVGWYNDNNELVSTEDVYRFAVKENTVLSAVFSEIPLYEIVFAAGEGGTITNASLTIPEGVNIQLEAIPAEGYEFDCWITNGTGEFENAKDACTIYTADAENITIEACFRKIDGIDKDDIKQEDILEDAVDLNTGKNNYTEMINVMVFSLAIALCIAKRRKG